jgi:hypothetical protein
MATYKPVVIKNGEFQQLQSGDDLLANGLKAFASGGVNIGGSTDPGAGGLRLEGNPGLTLVTFNNQVPIRMYSTTKSWGFLQNNYTQGDFALWQGTSGAADPFAGTVRLYVGVSGGLNVGATGDVPAGYINVAGALREVTGEAWTAYSPTVTPETGSFTTISSNGHYRKLGKTVLFRMEIFITTNGTAAGSIYATLPVNGLASAGQVLDVNILPSYFSGNAAIESGDTSKIRIFKYDGLYPGGSVKTIYIQGAYESD